MQIKGMRHHGRADDADRQQQRLGVGDLRHGGMKSRRSPVDRHDEHLDQITKRNDAHEAADNQFDRAEPEILKRQETVGHDRGHGHAGHERHMKQQGKADGAAQKFGKVGRHGGDLADPPHAPDHRRRKMIAAQLREIAAGDNPDLGRQRLKQHRDQVGEQHDPEQAVAYLAPAWMLVAKFPGSI